MLPVANIAVILITFALGMGLTIWVKNILLARAVLDQPNERSSHTIPTPRGGGWALLGIIVPGIILTSLIQNDFIEHVNILIAVLALAAVSWLDDRKGASSLLRLGTHIFAAFIGSLAFTHEQTLFAGVLPFWLDRLFMIIGWAWFINLYNFMDGIDGITSVETISIATGACLVMTVSGIIDPYANMLTLLLTGACLGFLALNWHPAKIFMGDIGSIPLGFLTGFLLLNIAVRGHLIAALIVPMYYLADSGITITRRALRGEKIWQAHRQHFYQKAALAVGRHDKVVVWIAGANIILMTTAIFSIEHPGIGLAIAIIITALLLIKMSPSLTKTMPML